MSQSNSADGNEITHLLELQKLQSEDKSSSDDKSSTSTDEADATTLKISFFLMLFFQLGNRIFFKLATLPMYNYPLYLNLMSTVVYIPISFAYIIPMMIYMPHIITDEQLEIPKYKFAIMGALDSLASIMAAFSVNFISNASIIVLIQQSAIPISMAISKLALQAEYSISQYSGAGIVVSGIFIVLVPNFFQVSTSLSSADDYTATLPEEETGGSELMWLLILALSCIPMCVSSVYKEFSLGEQEIDVVYLNGWVAVFQSFVALPLCIPSAILISLPLCDIFQNLIGGFYCNLGINSITTATATMPVDDCKMAPLFVWAYIFFNVVYNILIIVILKYGSSNILWLSSTLIVPLSNVAFALPFMPNNKPMRAIDFVGLFMIMTGLIIYRFSSSLVICWDTLRGLVTPEEIEADKFAKSIAEKANKATSHYIGFNQIEAISALIDTRVQKEQKMELRRTPLQIRSNFFVRLGVPPSPLMSIASRGSPSSRSIPKITSSTTEPSANAKKQHAPCGLSKEV